MDKTNIPMILGPCAMESLEHALYTCGELVNMRDRLRKAGHTSFEFIYKSSYSKANRTSGDSFRGVGVEEGIRIVKALKKAFNIQVTSDVHTVEEIELIGPHLDLIQIPHQLCRYTSIVEAAAKLNKPISLKKATFMTNESVLSAVEKIRAVGNTAMVTIIERGTQAGSNEVIVDMRNFSKTRLLLALTTTNLGDVALCMDASHPSGGSQHVAALACSGIVSGADTVFMEVHATPGFAPCDGHQMLNLYRTEDLLKRLLRLKKLM